MSQVIALLLALWPLLGANSMVREQATAIAFVDLYGAERATHEAVLCANGRPTMHFGPGAHATDFAHALMHAGDCLDDGTFNGSFGPPRPASPPTWLRAKPLALSYCWNALAEWQACQAEFDPHAVLRWLSTADGGSAADAVRGRPSVTPGQSVSDRARAPLAGQLDGR